MPRTNRKPTAATQRAIDKYGEDKCREAYEHHKDGNGAHTVAIEVGFSGTNAADAAINAGRDLEEIDAANRHETNIEFMARIMDFAKCGPMMQMFIMDSVTRMAQTVSAMPIEELRKQFEAKGTSNFIHPDAWQAAAKEFMVELNEHQGVKPEVEMHPMLKEIPADEAEALKAFANKFGHDWKLKLGVSWMTGGDHVPALQRLRNTKGPSWLTKLPANVFKDK